MLKVSSILIGVRSLEQAKDFYENVLGILFDEFRPPYASFTLNNLEFNVEENSPERDPDWAKMYIGGRKQVSFAVDDLEAFLVQAKKYGAQVLSLPKTKPWGWQEAVITDLDGNEFLIEQEL